jgi:hypothetical protein
VRDSWLPLRRAETGWAISKGEKSEPNARVQQPGRLGGLQTSESRDVGPAAATIGSAANFDTAKAPPLSPPGKAAPRSPLGLAVAASVKPAACTFSVIG